MKMTSPRVEIWTRNIWYNNSPHCKISNSVSVVRTVPKHSVCQFSASNQTLTSLPRPHPETKVNGERRESDVFLSVCACASSSPSLAASPVDVFGRSGQSLPAIECLIKRKRQAQTAVWGFRVMKGRKCHKK